ncbi:MAG TPA: bifunctional lysylphosphatidylglycerol flippase/synthetase MprF [Thermoanaerobaculia bacterium]|nr:bifunctional lysylphosphatidylglycerol flippase/synthetase MprF [Thermoanaerobaculia bacterium]
MAEERTGRADRGMRREAASSTLTAGPSPLETEPAAGPGDESAGTAGAKGTAAPGASTEPVAPGTPTGPASPAWEGRRRLAVPWELLRKLAPLFTVLLFAGALWLLHRALAGFRSRDVMDFLGALPPGRVAAALALTALGYLATTGYDALGFRNIRHPLPYRKIALAAFCGSAVSNSLGHPLFTGTPIRARLYSAWGLSALQVTRVVVFCFMTFWLGFLTLAGAAFLIEPLPLPSSWRLPLATVRPLGFVFLALIAGYLWLAARRKEPVTVMGVEMPLPGTRLAIGQILLSCLDWGAAGAVLYCLLPTHHGLPYLKLLAVFLMAQLAGLLSQVPGGLGVFETAIVFLLTSLLPDLKPPVVLGALVAFRGIYYFAPLLMGSLMLAGHEVVLRRKQVLRLARGVGSRASVVVPQLLSLTTFLGGALLLVSGATPAVGSRLEWLKSILPLPVIEVSHFVGSLAGVGLLLLALGLQRRLDAAYHLTVGLLATGIVVSLLKGLDYEEAIALGLMLAALLPCHRHFYRKAALTNEPFTPAWISAIGIVLAGSLWLGLFSYRHLEVSQNLWWRFTVQGGSGGNASRFLRAAVGTVALALGIALWRLLRPAVHRQALPSAADLDRAAAVVAASPRTYPYLALLGDKQLLFNEAGTAMLMYAVERRSWVAMGDPMGPESERAELAWRLRELSDQHGGFTVFYQVSEKRLHLYVDLGLSLIKLGEEARVPLANFSLAGAGRKKLRWAQRKAEELGARFEVVPASGVPALLPEIEAISNAWLEEKSTREKGFSLGFFSADYLRRLPLALVRGPEGILAFANLWLGGQGEELSIDLMRYVPEAPSVIMDYLFVELMLWGKQHDYRWFNLGMAPLSGLEGRAVAPLWSRLGTLVFRHGEYFYNFQGLRQYKEKFEPVWEPRYLACPGGLALPRVLADVSALISRGFRGLVAK